MSLFYTTFFKVWARYFVWNLKGYIWNSTQISCLYLENVLFLYKVETLGTLRFKISLVFLKWPAATSSLLDWTCTQALSNMHQTCCLTMSCHRPLQMGIVYVNADLQIQYMPRIMQGQHFLMFVVVRCSSVLGKFSGLFQVSLHPKNYSCSSWFVVAWCVCPYPLGLLHWYRGNDMTCA